MLVLVLGLVVFLGCHSVRIFAEGWRNRQIARLGMLPWRGLYSLVSVVGLVLIVWGYGMARAEPIVVWNPPVWTRHLAALLTVPAFILLVGAYIPGTRIKAALGHPMVVGVKVWAFSHLIANGTLADVALFGSIMVWAVVDYRAARQLDRAAGTVYAVGPISRDGLAVVLGLGLWAAFAFALHEWLIGVRPFG